MAMHSAPPPIWFERNGVSIDRKLRTAANGRLFRTECAPDEMTLAGTIDGPFPIETRPDQPKQPEWELIEGAAKCIRFFGGDSSRGLGGCKCRLV
jgi:hypothetical protein